MQRFEDYFDDLDKLLEFAKSRELGLPAFLLGHSAGGVTACLHVLEHQHKVAGFICEDFAFEVPAPNVALALLKGNSHSAPHARAPALKSGDFSRDFRVVKAMNDDPLEFAKSGLIGTRT